MNRFDGSTRPINDSLDEVRRWCGLSDGVNSRRNAEELTERDEHASCDFEGRGYEISSDNDGVSP